MPINSTAPRWLGSNNVMTAAGFQPPRSHWSLSLPLPYAWVRWGGMPCGGGFAYRAQSGPPPHNQPLASARGGGGVGGYVGWLVLLVGCEVTTLVYGLPRHWTT